MFTPLWDQAAKVAPNYDEAIKEGVDAQVSLLLDIELLLYKEENWHCILFENMLWLFSDLNQGLLDPDSGSVSTWPSGKLPFDC